MYHTIHVKLPSPLPGFSWPLLFPEINLFPRQVSCATFFFSLRCVSGFWCNSSRLWFAHVVFYQRRICIWQLFCAFSCAVMRTNPQHDWNVTRFIFCLSLLPSMRRLSYTTEGFPTDRNSERSEKKRKDQTLDLELQSRSRCSDGSISVFTLSTGEEEQPLEMFG